MVDYGQDQVTLSVRERHFFKMSGSGNDFVVINELDGPAWWLSESSQILAVCDRRRGIGGDGVVCLQPSDAHAFRLAYYNSDGGRADFCGNAALCSISLAVYLGRAHPAGFSFETDAGLMTGRIHASGNPEVDLPPVRNLRQELQLPLEPGERRAGYVVAGVPHAVLLCDNADLVELERRGPFLRRHPATKGGANVDFISPGGRPGAWRMRTYERGVEGETLACGSGAVASAILARLWDDATAAREETEIITSSGLSITVRISRSASELRPTLRGQGRVVFEGDLFE
jgi:diaminopimelate epimerase